LRLTINGHLKMVLILRLLRSSLCNLRYHNLVRKAYPEETRGKCINGLKVDTKSNLWDKSLKETLYQENTKSSSSYQGISLNNSLRVVLTSI
jgi:hypothetical protein